MLSVSTKGRGPTEGIKRSVLTRALVVTVSAPVASEMRVAILLATLACASGLIPRHLPTKLNRVVASSEVVAMKHAEQLSVAAAAFLLASTVASQPAFAGDIEAGSGIFSANCAACHAGGNNVIYSAKTLKKLSEQFRHVSNVRPCTGSRSKVLWITSE